MQNNSLRNSIILTVIIIAFIETGLMLTACIVYQLDLYNTLLFIGISIAYNLIIAVFLLRFRTYIYFEYSQKHATKINLANIITLFRISSAICLLYFYLSAINFPLKVITAIFTAIVFLSDFFDGFLARKLNQITTIGKYLDSTSDYIVLFIVSIIYTYYHLISLWFFILIILRFMVMITCNLYLFYKKKKIIFITSFLGKASIFALMALFVIKFILFIAQYRINLDKGALEYMVAGILIITIIEKIYSLLKRKSKEDSI